MPTINTHIKTELPLNADVAEWCPAPQAAPLLAVGTYQLDEATQQRLGRLHLYAVRRGEQEEGAAAGEQAAAAAAGSVAPASASGPPLQPQLRLAELHALELPGIFDLRWHPRSAMPQLAAALADGSLLVLTWGAGDLPLCSGSDTASPSSSSSAAAAAAAVPAAAQPAQEALERGEVAPGEMAVSLDYSRHAASAGERLVASFSSGRLQLFQAAPAGMASLAAWQAHELEAWAAATDHWHPDLLHSGGDDAAYCLWDARQGFAVPAWRNRKAHGAGVCCVASSPHQQSVVVTGSYDDRLRLWDLRAPHRPLLQAELDCGGGVWRAKWHPSQPQLLLAACMYNGFAVARAAGEAGSLEVLQTYEHAAGSLSYGADWCRDSGVVLGGSGGGGSLVATASFYDRQLHLWSYCP